MSKYILVFVFFSSIKYSHPTNSFSDIICEKTSWYSHEMFALDYSEASKALKISSGPSVFIGYSRGLSNKYLINNQNFTCYKMETNINNLNVCCVANLDINVDNGEIKADQSRNKKETKPHSKVIFKLVNYKIIHTYILNKNKLEDNLLIKKYNVNYKRRLKRNAQDIYNNKYPHLNTTYFDTTVDPVNDLSETENTITDFDITTDASVIKETNPTEHNDSTVASDTKDSTSYPELDPSTDQYSFESTTDPSIATDIDTTTQQLEYTDIDSTTYRRTDITDDDPSTSSETDSPAYSQSTYDSTDGDLTLAPSTVNPTTVISDDDDDNDDGDGDYKGHVSWSPWTIGLVVFASTVVVSILAVSTYHLGKISERSKEFLSEDLEPPNIVVIPRARLNRY